MDFCFDQSDLKRICADRPLVTSEIHRSNDFYGQAALLKQYADLDPEYSLKAVLEHGVNMSGEVWDNDSQAPLPLILAHSTARKKILDSLCPMKAAVAGFGFLYALQLVQQQHPIDTDRKGTLVFPCHSTHVTTNRFDHAEFAEKLASLPDEYKPVDICLYWKNFLLGESAEYEKRGLNVVSAGHMFDNLFLPRLADLCRRYRYATANEVGTHIFSSVSAGCRFFYTRSGPVVRSCPDEERKNDMMDDRYHSLTMKTQQLFAHPVDEITPEQDQFVREMIGTDHLLSPEQLRKVLNRAERLYRRRKLGQWAARKLSKFKRIKRSIVKRLPWTNSDAA